MGPQRTIELTVDALNRAFRRRRPPAGLVFHSDRGSEYAGYLFRDHLTRRGIVQSMNRPKIHSALAYRSPIDYERANA